MRGIDAGVGDGHPLALPGPGQRRCAVAVVDPEQDPGTIVGQHRWHPFVDRGDLRLPGQLGEFGATAYGPDPHLATPRADEFDGVVGQPPGMAAAPSGVCRTRS